MNTNGVISFLADFPYQPPTLFPGDSNDPVFDSNAVAPFWAAIDTRPQGEVRYNILTAGENAISDNLLGRVTMFINDQTDYTDFAGNWMLVATWDRVQEFNREENPVMSSNVSLKLLLLTLT